MHRSIRLALLAFIGATGLSPAALSADLSNFQWPWQSSPTYSDIPTYDWSGGYIAVMGGYNSATITAGDLAANLVDQSIPAWEYGEKARALAKASAADMTGNAAVYSIHAGFNIMAQRLVYGAEIEYGRFSPTITSSNQFQQARAVDEKISTNSAGEQIIDTISVGLAYTNKTEIQDFGLVNARAGYAFGRFMPYALVGLGVTRVKLNATMQASEGHRITVDGVYSPSRSYDITPPLAVVTKDAYAATVSLGLGFEYAVFDNLIVRAQYNYMTAGNVKGEGVMNNMARGGLALKF